MEKKSLAMNKWMDGWMDRQLLYANALPRGLFQEAQLNFNTTDRHLFFFELLLLVVIRRV